MTYTIRNHPGGYDIYKNGKCLSAREVVGMLEDRDRLLGYLREFSGLDQMSMENAVGFIEDNCRDLRQLLPEMEAKK